jgi:hypothetical protein
MSRFHGAQGKGASRRAQERRMWQAHLRQREYAMRRREAGLPFASSFSVLTEAAKTELVCGRVDVESWRAS